MHLLLEPCHMQCESSNRQLPGRLTVKVRLVSDDTNGSTVLRPHSDVLPDPYGPMALHCLAHAHMLVSVYMHAWTWLCTFHRNLIVHGHVCAKCNL